MIKKDEGTKGRWYLYPALQGPVLGSHLAHDLETLTGAVQREVIAAIVGFHSPVEEQLRGLAILRVPVEAKGQPPVRVMAEEGQNLRYVGDLTASEQNAVYTFEEMSQLLLVDVIPGLENEE